MILPPATLGMLGGGQLGRFFVAAAHEMGYHVWVLDPDPHSPAALIADRHLLAAYDDYAALDELAQGCAAISTEFENVPAGTLDYLEQVRCRAPVGGGGQRLPEPHRRKELPARQWPATCRLRRSPP
jgi:phosphoribosylaminoimidazole carboxylase (NCAIR synthetase)